MKQDFDLFNYIPSDSYATEFVNAQKLHFPDQGFSTAVYCGKILSLFWLTTHIVLVLSNEHWLCPGGVKNCWLGHKK